MKNGVTILVNNFYFLGFYFVVIYNILPGLLADSNNFVGPATGIPELIVVYHPVDGFIKLRVADKNKVMNGNHLFNMGGQAGRQFVTQAMIDLDSLFFQVVA